MSNYMRNHSIGLALILAAVILVALFVLTQTILSAPLTSDYEVVWSSVDAGGVMNSIGGGYTLDGTIAQYDAGAQTGAGYTLLGGFWGDWATQYRVFLPLTLR